jgi:hypothetical protein
MKAFSRSAIAVFCDDVREEKSDQKTIVGSYPPELVVDEFPYTFPKLCAYSQFSSSTDEPIKRFNFKVYQDDDLILDHPAPDKFVEDSYNRSIAGGRPSFFLFTSIELVGFEIDKPCTFYAVAEVDGVEHEAARLAVSDEKKVELPIKKLRKKTAK